MAHQLGFWSCLTPTVCHQFLTSGNGCGYSDGFEDYTYVYWPAITVADAGGAVTEFDSLIDRTVCVSECPDKNDVAITDSGVCKANDEVTCTEETTRYNTERYFGKMCLPEGGSDQADEFREKFFEFLSGDNTFTQYMGDLVTSWWVMLICAFCGFIFGFIYMLLLRCCAKIMVFVTIVLVFFLLLGTGTVAWFWKNRYDSSERTYKVYYGLAITFWVLTLLYAVLVCCCCRAIRIALGIIEATAVYVATTPQIFLIPVVFFFLSVIWSTYSLMSILWIWSAGDPEKRDNVPFAKMDWDWYTRSAYWYSVFGYFWVNAFLVGAAQFILAVGVATWYFSHTTDSSGGKKRGSARIRSGFLWLGRYHQGSIALGSMIIAICQLIRAMFEWY